MSLEKNNKSIKELIDALCLKHKLNKDVKKEVMNIVTTSYINGTINAIKILKS
jgi:hypothetical protein